MDLGAKMPKFNIGDKVKFLDNLWERKKAIGQIPFFGPAIKEDAKNCFTIKSYTIQDEETVEYQLNEFPWLVYEEELEIRWE